MDAGHPEPVSIAAVSVVEVSPRDGLQSEAAVVSVADKVELVRRVVAAGLRRVETASFVNPDRVPQMADADEVMAELNRPGVIPERAECSFIGLVLNDRGLDRAVATGVDEVNVVVVCSDTFAQRNQGRDTEGLIATWHRIGPAARAAGLRTSVTLSASFGCPYEGEVPVERFEQVVERVLEVPPDEVALADTIGVAVPTEVRDRVERLRMSIERAGAPVALRGHFHNTRNTGVANVAAAVESGVPAIDASLGGIGGCPFAPNATGNVATEDVVYLLHRMGFATGVDLDAACAVVPWLAELVGHPTSGLVSRAGVFPAR